jgi:DNA-binding NtrC family response regulator
MAESEEVLIREALSKSGANLSRAAELLGIARGTLYSKMRKYGIEK